MTILFPANLHVHDAPTAGLLAVKRTSPIRDAKDLNGKVMAVIGLNNIADIFGDRQFHARRNLVAMDAPDTGEQVIVPAPVPRLSETPGRVRTLGPKLGEHSSEVLRELLGLDEAQIAALRAKSVI